MPAPSKSASTGKSANAGDTLLLVGTMKGAFIFRSNSDRSSWTIDGPHFPGEAVYALAYDDRAGRNRLLASTRSFHWGANIRRSDDFGANWTAPDRQAIRFPEASGHALVQVWQITPGRRDEPDVLYAGVEPSCLFESRDAGETWTPVEGILNHEHRPKWTPGGGGMCLHTIVPDPANKQRMIIAMSTGGAYRTDDGGKTWRARNVGVRAQFLPNPYPEFGQCVHKIAHHKSKPERLFLQNHWGLYRSDDWGDNWTDIANGVPSDFGFAMTTHSTDADTVYIVPLKSDEFRCTPDAKMRVYRTRNAGDSWEPLANGLPQENAFETVVRDGMCNDTHKSSGVYFGTRSGKVFASNDGGDSWMSVAESLPPVVCVKTAVVA
jgi:hypothetical protein